MGQTCSREDETGKQFEDPQHNKPAETFKAAEPVKPTEPKEPLKAAVPLQPEPQKVSSPTNKGGYKLAHSMLFIPSQAKMTIDELPVLAAANFPDLQSQFLNSTNNSIIEHTQTGATYQGQTLEGVPHGFGRMVFKDGTVKEGFFMKGEPYGFMRTVIKDTFTEGRINKEGQLHGGRGKKCEANGSVTQCDNWMNGQPSGAIESRSKDGKKLFFKGTQVNGQKQGECFFYNAADKYSLSGTFKDDKLQGKGKKVWDNGQVYIGDFKDSVEEGKGVLYYFDGRKFEGPFNKGKPNGIGKFYKDDGSHLDIRMNNGVKA